MSNVWGKFWHTYIRLVSHLKSKTFCEISQTNTDTQPVLGFGNFIIHCLHIPSRSPIAYLIILTTAFAISNFFHIVCLATIRDENLSLRTLITDMSLFFMTQPLAASAEALAINIFSKLNFSSTPESAKSDTLKNCNSKQPHSRGKTSLILRIIGYVWVLVWFSITGWGFTKGYVAVGVRDWQIPMSLCHALLDWTNNGRL